jgi:AraC family transcriptional regulator, glycine betaine-responsive activator
VATGFSSATHFARSYRLTYGRSPSAERTASAPLRPARPAGAGAPPS